MNAPPGNARNQQGARASAGWRRSGNDQRPDPEAGALGDRWAPTEPILRVRATVSVDLDHGDEHGSADHDREDRHALEMLSRVPAGAHVLVNVGRRDLLTWSAARWLHEAAQRLDVEIVGADPQVVRRWYAAITAGTVS